jgi:1-acyl-sn-glycerol-3-phosphate acyltransferase
MDHLMPKTSEESITLRFLFGLEAVSMNSKFMDDSTSSSKFRWRWYDCLLLYWPFGWLMLFNRHWNRYHSKLRKPAWKLYEMFFFLIPFGFYIAVVLRWLREKIFPSSLTSDVVTKSCPHCGERCIMEIIPCPEYPYHFSKDLFEKLANRYYKTEIHGIEKIPADGPALIMMNHAGMAFPWDFVSLGSAILRKRGSDFWLRAPGEKVFLRNPILTYILPQRWMETIGGVEATFDEFEKILKHKQISLYAPEGAAGMAKGWHKRYHLQHFHTSFVKLASKHHAKIIPVVCIGGENLHPWSFNMPRVAKLLGFPFFGISPFAPFVIPFPSMLVWSLPTKLEYHIFDPIELAYCEVEDHTDAEWQEIADQFKAVLQKKIDSIRD